MIDPALLRPGRFDKLLYIGPCTDFASKTAVLKAQTRKYAIFIYFVVKVTLIMFIQNRFNLSEDIDLSEVVRICPNNITGADFYGICSNAWSSAVKRLIKKIEEGR